MKNTFFVKIALLMGLATPFASYLSASSGGHSAPKPQPKQKTAAELQAEADARHEAERLQLLAQQRPVHYGDKIVIMNKVKYIVLTETAGTASVSNRNGKGISNTSDAEGQLWYVKGPHTRNDPWNCIPGEMAKNKDTIRLECAETGGNLSTTGSGDNISVCLNGKQGTGTSRDNWVLTVQGSGQWLWGAPFTLTNVDTGFVINVTEGGSLNALRSIAAAPQTQSSDTGLDAATQKTLDAQLANAQNAQAQAAQSTTPAKPAPTAPAQPSVPNDPASASWWVCNAQVATPPEDDIGWTGSPSGSMAEPDDSSMVAIEIVKLGMGGGIPPTATQDFSALSADKKPFLAGFAKDKIDQFSSSNILTVNPLKNKGCAWLGESLQTPGRATIQFRAKAEDKGDIQIIFGQDVGTEFIYKIRIGGYDNTQSVITRYTQQGAAKIPTDVAVITQEQNPLAVARPGSFSSYWVSVDNGLIFVGAGDTPGDNIFLTWRDPNPPADLRRVGFGTNLKPVVYTEIQIRPPVISSTPQRTYYPNTENPGPAAALTAQQFGSQIFKAATTTGIDESSANIQWSQFPLRVPGRGSCSFGLNGSKQTALVIADSQSLAGDYYAIVFGADENNGIRIKRHSKTEGTCQTLAYIDSKNYPALKLSPSKPAGYWVSLEDGQISVGMGRIGQNVVLSTQDLLPLQSVVQLGFVANSGESATYSNLSIASPVKLGVMQSDETYQKQARTFDYSGAVYIVLPFEYQIDQEGQSVKFTDKIGGQTFYPGATPQQDTQYYFMITVQPDGFPQLDWVSQPENPQIIALQKKITIDQATSEALSSAGQSISGSGMIGGVIGTIASMALAGASAGIAAGKTAHEQATLNSYRDVNSYVYTDKMNQLSLGSSDIPPEAQANALDVKSKLDLGGKWTPSSTDKFERLVSLYQQVIFQINHPYVVKDQSVKPNLFSAITALYNARKTLYPGLDYQGAQAAYNSLLNLLISAQDNVYIINPDKPEEAKQKDVWYTWINELMRDLLSGHAATPVDLQPFHGEYIWLADALPAENNGIIVFEAKGLNDVMVAFGQATIKTRNTSNEIYEIDLGGWENTKTAIRVQSLDTPIASFTKEQQPDAMLNSLDYKRFWIALQKGTITIGTGDVKEENKILQWNDVYPIKRLKYIGISTWDAPVSLRNVYVGPFVDFKSAAAWDQDLKKTIADAEAAAQAQAEAAAQAGQADPSQYGEAQAQ